MKSLLPVKMFCIWGGTCFKQTDKTGKIALYQWNISRRKDVKRVLKKITPFLSIKKDQAELALRMIDVAEEKPANYKKTLKRLGDRLSKLKHPILPDIDLVEFSRELNRQKEKAKDENINCEMLIEIHSKKSTQLNNQAQSLRSS